MAEREVVTLNEPASRLEVPQVGDSYTMPRSVTVTGDVTATGVISGHIPIDPVFTYSSGVLSQIDYADGEQKVFVYDVNGLLEQMDYIVGAVTLRKEYFYTGSGQLDYITQTYI